MFKTIRKFFVGIDAPELSITDRLLATLRDERDYHHSEIDALEKVQSRVEKALHQHYAAATAIINTLSALVNPRERVEHDAGEYPAPGSILYHPTGQPPLMSDSELSAAMGDLRTQFRSDTAEAVTAALPPELDMSEIDLSGLDALELAEDMQDDHGQSLTRTYVDDPEQDGLTRAATITGPLRKPTPEEYQAALDDNELEHAAIEAGPAPDDMWPHVFVHRMSKGNDQPFCAVCGEAEFSHIHMPEVV